MIRSGIGMSRGLPRRTIAKFTGRAGPSGAAVPGVRLFVHALEGLSPRKPKNGGEGIGRAGAGGEGSGSLIDVQQFNGEGTDLYIRLQASELDNDRKDRRLVIIIPVVVGFIAICVSIFFANWCWFVKRKPRDKTKKVERTFEARGNFSSDSTAIVLKDTESKVNIDELPLFTFETLAEATDGFHDSKLLGKGGFGPVYKGNLANGKEIAVKRLSAASRQGVEEFMNEVIVISKLQHRNLVRLMGCCVEKEEKMLVYEYMPNKSLDFSLFDSTNASQKVLDWKKRSSIMEGIGRGLLYLHRDSRLRIIHRDLKPSNVLLDADWNPKIFDFGMARIFGCDQDHGDTARVVGTYGYMAPEYAISCRQACYSDCSLYALRRNLRPAGAGAAHLCREMEQVNSTHGPVR